MPPLSDLGLASAAPEMDLGGVGAPANDFGLGALGGLLGQQSQAPPAPTPIERNKSALAALFEQARASAADQAAQPFKFSTDGKGGMTVAGDGKAIMQAIEGAQKYREMVQGYVDQKQARIQQTQQNPIPSILGLLAGNMAANDPKLPGWLRGLGATAAQLNPTVPQLQQEQMGLYQQLQQSLQGQSKLAMEQITLNQGERRVENDEQRVKLEEKHYADVAEKTKKDDYIKARRADIEAAVKGEAAPEASAKTLVESGLMRPDQAGTYAEMLAGIQKAGADQRDAASGKKFAQEKALQLSKAAAEADRDQARFAQQSDLFDKKLAATRSDDAKKAAAAETKANAKLLTLPAVPTTELAHLAAADASLDQMEKTVKDSKNQKYMGPFMGRLIQLDPKRSTIGLETQFALQTAQAIKSTGAGARGFGQSERPFFEKMAEAMTRAPEQNLQIISKWRDYIDQARRGLMLANPSADWGGKYAAALGPRLAPFLPPPAAASEAAPVTAEDVLKAMGRSK